MSFSPSTLLAKAQPLGRALMLPIAVLPIAALLLRLGQADMLNVPFIAAAGDAIFSNLGLLFAAGVAVGLARENHGAASLAGVVTYLVATEGAKVLLHLPPDLAGAAALEQAAWRAKEISKLSVPVGICSGIVAGLLYNRFHAIRLPDYLSFFGGRRFVPIVSGLAGLVFAAAFGLGFPWFEAGIDALSRWVLGAGSLGLFLYGLLNRLLLITGLHHIINNIAWFLLGDFHGATGDIKRFFAGDPTAGSFMAGFFPVMMFGLPAACLAMYHTAAPERRKAVGGMLLSLALTSFLTGVTEPIEFSFMFLAPALYVAHAVLTGLAHVVMHLLDVKLGYGFSAGLFDYVLNYGRATHPLLLLPVGLAYAAIYYGLFRWAILKFDLKTPGREAAEEGGAPAVAPAGDRAGAIVAALGGAGNLRTIDACTTRLRLRVEDMSALDEPALRALGARGILKLADNNLQVVVGGIADTLAMEMRDFVGRPAPAAPVQPDTEAGTPLPAAIAAALGGAANLVETSHRPGRIRVVVQDPEIVDRDALAANARAVIMPAARTFHLLVVD
jgi:PTS system N-acetylglucosamine-specific IIC component